MGKLYVCTFLLALMVLPFHLSAQDTPLPNGFTPVERNVVSGFSFRNAMMSPPPPSAVRTAAEWEEVEYLVVTWDPWYPNILRQIVQAAVAECKVIITTDDEASVSEYLTSNGIPLANIIFMNAPWDSIWTRDYSANTVYANDVGERALVDWIYNRPRPNDNVMPSAHAALTGIPIYVTDSGLNDLVNTGGNWMSDGLGNAFASELILDENDEGNPYGVSVKTEGQIDGIMQSYMGISNYIKMPTLPYDGIHHIDMHMKLLNEETLLVSRYPAGVADGPQIEANIANVVANNVSHFGTPYKVEWINAPPSVSGAYPDTNGYYRTYSNATIVNKTVLIPLYRPETDAAAIAKYQQLMPGYTIVGIDVDDDDETLIASSGAIHCITHTIGVDEPLLIVHQPVKEGAAGTSVSIHAMIKHVSGINNAKVFWRNQGTTDWNEATMNLLDSNNWTVAIPLDTDGIDAEYYIWAHANSGKSLARPMVAPTGFWTISSEALSLGEWAVRSISAAYPNPAGNTVNFDLKQIEGPIAITITNLLGQQLYGNTINNGNGTVTLNLAGDWNGTLFVTFEGGFGKVVRKVLKG